MTSSDDCTLPASLWEAVAQQGFDGLPEMLRLLLNAAMLLERQRYWQAEPHERTPERIGRANGFKPKTLHTRMGAIPVAVPQVREGAFYPSAWEKGVRSERALKRALAEMDVQGVSTRRVAAITPQLCGFEVSSPQVRQAAAQLDAVLQAWRERPRGRFPYLYLDVRYETVRQDGAVRDAAVLIASGVHEAGKRPILGVSVALSEREVHWRSCLSSLVARGLRGVQLLVSDDHAGLGAARKAVLGGVPWQRCQFHLQPNAQAYVPRQEMKAAVAADIRAIFTALSRTEAEALLRRTVETYRPKASKLADWMEANLSEGLTVLAFPESHRRLLRTTNGLERVNQEIRRRTRVVGLFPHEDACLRLVSAVLMEISEEWETGKAYLTFTT